jgi:flagellar basal body-associated protein FliL
MTIALSSGIILIGIIVVQILVVGLTLWFLCASGRSEKENHP